MRFIGAVRHVLRSILIGSPLYHPTDERQPETSPYPTRDKNDTEAQDWNSRKEFRRLNKLIAASLAQQKAHDAKSNADAILANSRSKWALWIATTSAIFTLLALGASYWQGIIANKSLLLSEQAFVTLHNVEQSSAVIGQQTFTYWKPVLENTGSTPTVGLHVWVACLASKPDLFSFVPASNSIVDRTLIAPKATYGERTCGVPQAAIPLATSVGQTFFIYGEADYLDIFRNRHKTRWCDMIQHDIFTNSFVLAGCTGRNSKFECADDECSQAE